MKLLSRAQIFIFLFFVSIYLIVYLTTTADKNQLIKLKLDQQIENLQNNYKVSINQFSNISKNFYFSYLNNKDVLEILYKAKYAKNEEERKVLREALYAKMRPYFRHLSQSGVNILLFSFENNKTFLRVHKSQKYGDDLSSVRYSIRYVNDEKRSINGFEQGKISHAFRNVFPIFYKDEYLGSVDLAFSSEVLQENMTKMHKIDTHFIVDKSIFDVKVWERQNKVKYIKSIEHKDFLFSLTNSQKNKAFSDHKIQINKKLKEEIARKIEVANSFALYERDEEHMHIIAFYAIKNIKDKRTVAYLVSYSDSPELKIMLYKYIWINILSFLGLLILAFAVSYNVKQRYLLELKVKQEVEKNKKQQQFIFEQARLAQMGEMISMIAHQWRQPLGSISATSADLQIKLDLEQYDLDDKVGVDACKTHFIDSLQSIDLYVKTLTNTIDDFRNFYKPNKQMTTVNLEDVVDKAIKLIEPSLHNDNIHITKVYNSHKKVELYENEMMHVILNILKNAQDNFKERLIVKPIIEIKIEDSRVEISDNGGGIKEDIVKKVFDPYFSTKKAKNGTGLGLYMSKLIVEDHHKGRLAVSNEKLGACFILAL